MAIRFACPSCRQPIEVDDDWAGQSAACPYCRHVVTAPAASSWPATDIPQAAPGGPPAWQSPPPPQPNPAQPIPTAIPGATPTGATPAGVTPAWPPPPAPGYPARPEPARGASAGWALALALASVALGGFAVLAWGMMLVRVVSGQLGANPTPEQMDAFIKKQMAAGAIPHDPLISAAFILGAGVAALALIASIRAMVRREHMAMAVAACVIAVLFLMCNGMMSMSMLVMTGQSAAP